VSAPDDPPLPDPASDGPLPSYADADAPVLLWAAWSGNGAVFLLVLPEPTVEHWLSRAEALRCTTWGEVRDRCGIEVHDEVLDLAGVLDPPPPPPSGEHPPGWIDPWARRTYDGVPEDDEAFDAHSDIPECADGDWPPHPQLLMAESLPVEFLEAFAEPYVTTFNGVYAHVDAEHEPEAVRWLAHHGYQTREDQRVASLLSPVYG
jgi:hypothetical protein